MANYTITIKASDFSGRMESPVAGDTKVSDTEKSKGLLSKEGAKTFGKVMVSYNAVKSFATQIVNHEVSMVELRTGSNELQQRANFINQTIQQGIGIIESTVTGALVGGLPGAIFGAVVGVAHTLIGYAQNQEKINTQKALEDVSLGMNYIRAGVNGSRRG